MTKVNDLFRLATLANVFQTTFFEKKRFIKI